MFLSRNTTLGLACLSLSVFGNLVISDPVKAEIEIYRDCKSGSCFELFFIDKTKVEDTQLGELYETRTVNRDLRTGERSEVRTSYVFCSTSRPAVANHFPHNNDDLLYVDFVNPGEIPAYNAINVSYVVYWATCHDLFGTFGNREQAQRWGYPMNHEQRQERMSSLDRLIYP